MHTQNIINKREQTEQKYIYSLCFILTQGSKSISLRSKRCILESSAASTA